MKGVIAFVLCVVLGFALPGTVFGSLAEQFHDPTLPLPTSVHELQAIPKSHQRKSTSRHFRGLQSHGSELTPLYPGFGTHFSYIYVGTPPQRQSVIIDTGSHFTAFPCTGCSQCGQHTDPYWDYKNSSTVQVLQCGASSGSSAQTCAISQSYSEGSSWKAFKVVDKVWISGLNAITVPDSNKYAVDFMFGCQTYETGLFRTQLADGIMGMAMAEETLPFVLTKQGVTSTRMFSLCYRIGGGIMTIGGVDQRIHSRPGIQYAKLTKTSGWFTVKLVDILLQDQYTGNAKSLEEDESKYNSGKGCIVDSGTTDTYLPAELSSKFSALFKEISGIAFTSANVALSSEQLSKIPDVVFVFEGVDGQRFQVAMPWTSYVDNVGGGKYAFRIYLTEGSGTVLGANFMNNYNIIFDPDNTRLGFAKSSCKFEDYAALQTRAPVMNPTRSPIANSGDGSDPNGSSTSQDDADCASQVTALDECSARCDSYSNNNNDFEVKRYIAFGNQTFNNRCFLSSSRISTKPCRVSCNDDKIVRGDPQCPEKPWGECSKACIQSRLMPESSFINNRRTSDESDCRYKQQTRNCYTGSCPLQDGDYLVFVDLRVKIDPTRWSYVHTEDFYAAFADLFKVKENSIELMNDASAEYSLGAKLHFQIRLQRRDYSSLAALNNAAQGIAEDVWDGGFGQNLISALVRAANRVTSKIVRRLDHHHYHYHHHVDVVSDVNHNNRDEISVGNSRYGWLIPSDVEVLNAMAMPIGDMRDPIDDVSSDTDSGFVKHVKGVMSNQWDLILLGVAMVSLTLMVCVLYYHNRLQVEHAALAKEKSIGSSLLKSWMKFVKSTQSRVVSGITSGTSGIGSSNSNSSNSRGSRHNIKYQEVQLMDVDDDDDFGDDSF